MQRKFDLRLTAYMAAMLLFSPFFLFRKIKRRIKKCYKYEFDLNRHWIPWREGERTSPDAVHVVFVASGLGEQQMAERLTLALNDKYPDVYVTWAIKVVEIVDKVSKEDPKRSVTFMPFDNTVSVKRWLGRIQPDVVVSIENLWLPCIAWGARNCGAKVVVACGDSGRYKPGFFHKLTWSAINTWSLRAFNIICLHSEAVRDEIKEVLPSDVDTRITGAIKLKRREERKILPAEFMQWLQPTNEDDVPVLAAGSTRNEEEENFVLDAFSKVRKEFPCKLLLAPRHLHRADEVERRVQSYGLTTQRRSGLDQALESPQKRADVIVLDTLGELATAYEFCAAAFIGGTLRAPGHNIIEPIEKGIPVSFGKGKNGVPSTTQKMCMDVGIGFRVATSDELAKHWQTVLADPSLRGGIADKISHVYAEQERIIELNSQAVVELVELKMRERNSN